MLRDIEAPLDATTRVRVFCNCTDLSPRTRLSDPGYATSIAFFGSEHGNHAAENGVGGTGTGTVCVDLTSTLAQMAQQQGGLSEDRLMVQLLPHCANTESNVSNVRPRRVEIVIL